jgi:hypothetical protein
VTRRYSLIVTLVSALLLLLTLLKPLTFDNALYQTMAYNLHHFGKVPYIGTWDQNFPGIVYLHYFIIVVFGSSDIAVRWFDIIVQVLFAVYLFSLWKRWLKPSTAALSVILYISYYVSAGGLLLSQRDVYAGMLLMVTFDLFLRARENTNRSSVYLLASGLLSGMTAILRPTAMLWTSIFLLALVFSSGLTAKKKIRSTILFGVAVLLPLALIILYYAQIPGALHEAYLSTIRWNLDLYTKVDNGFEALGMQFARRALLTPLAIYGLICFHASARFFDRLPKNFERNLYGALALGSLGVALFMQKDFDYHFAPFFLFVTPLAALGIEQIVSRVRSYRLRIIATATCVFAATLIVYPPKLLFTYCSAIVHQRDPALTTYLAAFPDQASGAAAERQVLAYLNTPENANATVQICSFRMNLQNHLHRESPTRYLDFFPLAYRLNPSEKGAPQYTDYQRQWQRAFVDSLREKQVDFLILLRHTPSVYLNDVYDDCLRWIPGFDNLLNSGYRKDTVFGSYELYRRR